MDLHNGNKQEVKELEKELEYMSGGKNECAMCKAVLAFAFIVLVLVIIFSFFLRVQSNKANSSSQILPPEKVIPPTAQEWDQHVLELGQLFHPELKGTTSPAGNTMAPFPPPPATPSGANVNRSKMQQ